MNYYKYVKKFMHNPSSTGFNESYKMMLLKSINNMYDELKKSKIPTNVTLPNLPGDPVKTVLVHPISFGIPSIAIKALVPPKSQSFCSVIPGKKSTYIWDEKKYYEDLQKSLFTITYKKSGWDCFRHLEIMASGGLPLFISIKRCPPVAMALHPKAVYSLLLQFPGLQEPNLSTAADFQELPVPLSFKWEELDYELYSVTAEALLHYTRNVLSCERIASHLLETVAPSLRPRHRDGKSGKPRSSRPHNESAPSGGVADMPRSILYLTHRNHNWLENGDYMVDLLLLGLKAVLDPAAVLDFPRRNPLYREVPQHFNESAELAGKQRLYGKGYTYGLSAVDALTSDERSAAGVEQRLRARGFDLVVLGSGHITNPAAVLPLWDLVCEIYDPSEVAVVDGGDDPLGLAVLHRYAPCAQHFFSREGYIPTNNPHTADGMLLKEFKGREVYLMQNGLRRPFGSATAFTSRGFDFGNVTAIHQLEMITIPLGPVLT